MEPIGWNLYSNASDRSVTEPPELIAFIPNEDVLGAVESAFADEVEAFTAAEVCCGTELLPPPQDTIAMFARAAAGWGAAVNPQIVPRLGRVHGPRPARCAREPHPNSPWHWDGRGTWWR